MLRWGKYRIYPGRENREGTLSRSSRPGILTKHFIFVLLGLHANGNFHWKVSGKSLLFNTDFSFHCCPLSPPAPLDSLESDRFLTEGEDENISMCRGWSPVKSSIQTEEIAQNPQTGRDLTDF